MVYWKVANEFLLTLLLLALGHGLRFGLTGGGALLLRHLDVSD